MISKSHIIQSLICLLSKKTGYTCALILLMLYILKHGNFSVVHNYADSSLTVIFRENGIRCKNSIFLSVHSYDPYPQIHAEYIRAVRLAGKFSSRLASKTLRIRNVSVCFFLLFPNMNRPSRRIYMTEP